MAEVKFPIQIDGFRCVEDMAQAVLGYKYKEKTLKEWADSISEPKTKADQIRTMTDQELAEFLIIRDLHVAEEAARVGGFSYKIDREQCLASVIRWLKEEAE